jgi:two-component system, response regulator PdtaR
LRISLADVLRHHGFNVIEAANADEALRLLRRSPHVDLILTDIELERSSMDGLALATAVHERDPHIRIVVASGNRPAQLPDGTAAFFAKPYSFPVIVHCVRELVER